jgi:hypothetical protein
VYIPSATTGLTSELLDNEIEASLSDEADCGVASGSTKISDVKIDGGEIDGGERTHPAPSVDDMNQMDVDTAQIAMQSVSSGKRKFSTLHNDISLHPSLLSSEPTATSDATTSERTGKKRSTGKERQPRKISARKATEISNATVLHGMQGTMNRVTDIFEKSVTQPLDPQSSVRSEALHYLQTREDDLNLNQTTQMVRVFMKDNIAAETYVALVNDNLRRNWLAQMLAE